VTRYIEAAWLGRVMTYADDCDRAGSRLLDHVKTIDSVRDMNAIRVALGASQLNYYGYSYGWYDANLDQDVSFETVIQLFFKWVARYDSVYGLGGSRRATLGGSLGRLNGRTLFSSLATFRPRGPTWPPPLPRL